jgi:hypothetical protein
MQQKPALSLYDASLAEVYFKHASQLTGVPEKFPEWCLKNPHVIRRFIEEANKLWHTGRRRWASCSLIYYIRHETALAEKGGDWKINQNWSAPLARLYMQMYPDRPLFKLKPRKAA